MKLKLDKKVKMINGKELDETFASVLANNLANLTEGNSVKILSWALQLNDSGQVELADSSDVKTLRDIVEKLRLPAYAKAPIIEAIDSLKESK